jgi:hypothetical protein
MVFWLWQIKDPQCRLHLSPLWKGRRKIEKVAPILPPQTKEITLPQAMLDNDQEFFFPPRVMNHLVILCPIFLVSLELDVFILFISL